MKPSLPSLARGRPPSTSCVWRSIGLGGRGRQVIPAIALAFLLLPAVSGSQSATGDPLTSRQKELRDLKARIEENRKKIENLQKKEKEVGALTGRLARDRDMTVRYLTQLEEQERAIMGDLSVRQNELDQRTTDERKAAARLRSRLRLYQRSRRLSVAEILISSRSFPDLFARGAILSREIQRNRADLIRLGAEREEIEDATDLLASRRDGLLTLQEEKLREKARLERKSADAEKEIERLRRERGEFEARQKTLAQSEAQIRTLIEKLEAERRKPAPRGKAAPPSGPGLTPEKGRLPWPVKGSVIGRFGVELHPRFGTKVPSNGVDIAVPSGTRVSAVAAGTAEFVDWLSGYGRCVILNHGGGFYTLYAHCSRVLIARGAKVAANQAIAESGDTDSIKGPCLHFEIRRGEEAMNPEEWLRR
jgi:murein hydrolase activator